MTRNNLQADYLVVGAGAMGMAFTDVLVCETDATVVMVDRYHKPGGHWNVAYPFVRLHQPSSFYGVNSKVLGNDTIDQVGYNKGLYELASSAEVLGYFDQVMQQQFLPTGRVQYFPMCEYTSDGRFASLVTGDQYEVEVSNKTVDATYMDVSVPAMRPPPFPVAAGMRCVPPNELVRIPNPNGGYVILGAGKTAMDAALWLLERGVDPDDITWIMPRDSWLLNRANLQPELMTNELAGTRTTADGEALADAETIDELFSFLESTGQLLRLDQNVRPTMYRCATVTIAELHALRRIKNIVRQGHVTEITSSRIVLEQGTLATNADVLHVDCTADGLARRPMVSVFDGKRLTLQAIRTCQQVFSAAFIAHVEATVDDEASKNRLCTPVPHPDSDLDWLRTTLGAAANQGEWMENREIQNWLAHSRLDGFTRPPAPGKAPKRIPAEAIAAAVEDLAKMQSLLSRAESSEAQ